MKNFLIASALILPMTGFANTISFKCQSVDVQGIHKFDAEGIVSVDDVNNVEGIISLHAEKAQSAQSVQIFEEVRVKGFIRHIEAGVVVPTEFDQMVLTTNEPYLKSINLLLGYPDRLASKVFTIDNFSFRSNCKIIK
jgi:hypothetical protein